MAQRDNRSGTRVVVVADHDIFRAGLLAILARLTLVVVAGEARNEDAGLAACRSSQPDVVMLEALPGADTAAFIGRVRRACPRTAVVVLAERPRPQDVVAAVGAGATGYLLKDAPADDLATAIDRAVAGEAFVDPALAGRVVQQLWRQPIDQPAVPRPEPLTRREREVLAEVSRGRSNKEIASDLDLAVGTVKIHVERILRKLAASNRAEASTRAVRYGLIGGDEHDRTPDELTQVP